MAYYLPWLSNSTGSGSTINVASPYGVSEFNTAVAAASDGDTVAFPSGVNVTWSTAATAISKAIKIQGKSYVLVSDRVNFFNEAYPNGCIKTEKLESSERVEFRATVVPDSDKPERYFTGHSQAQWGQGMVSRQRVLALKPAGCDVLPDSCGFSRS